jgi:hypothetical protein
MFTCIVLAASAGCGQVRRDNQLSDETQEDATASGGVTASSGGATGDLSFDPSPPSTLTDDCTLTTESTEYRRRIAEEVCFSTALFFTEGRQEEGGFWFPTLPELGVGGVGGAASEQLMECPAASALDWSCHLSEGANCSFPQCELPTTPSPVGGDCCYVVAMIGGV